MAGTGHKTEIRSRQLDRTGFVARLRELIDEGLTREQLIEKLNPIRGFGVGEQFMRDALDSITSALAIAASVSNPRMQQAYADFVHCEKRALDEAHVYSCRCAHIESAYPDPNIRRAKRIELDRDKDKWRILADQAAVDWVEIQKKRIPYDQAVQQFPQAFSEYKPWKPKPLK